MQIQLSPGERLQRKYYSDTAAEYDLMHAHEGATDPSIICFVTSILHMIEVRSVLDVGTATGLGLRNLKNAFPNAFICGVEPVAALVEHGTKMGNIESGPIVLGSGNALPFRDASFDVVCEFAVLHHVSDPSAVVKEMLRVARKAVVISDSNRFGQGSRLARFLKLGLYKTKLWGAYNYLRTAGRRYRFTEGDGIAYSYSVYDSFELIYDWGDEIILYSATDKRSKSWAHPLLTSGGLTLCVLKRAV